MRASSRSLTPIATTIATALAICIPCHAETPPHTITSLTLSSASVTTGTTVTLTAHVTASGSAVHPGTVIFCNASAPHCEDTAIFGTAQLTTNGTAKLYLRLAPNTYSIRATFFGTLHSAIPRAASSSTVLPLTVHGIAATLTSPPTATRTGSLYHVATTIVASGAMPLTGTVSFHDTVNDGTPMALGSSSISATAPRLTYDLPIPSNTPIVISTLTSGDFNNDGIPDIAAYNFYSDFGHPQPVDTFFVPTVAILLSNGDGTFTPTSFASPADFPDIVATGDFNNDGNIDIAVGGDFGGVLLGHGDGTFSTVFSEGDPLLGVSPVTVADIDGDGNLDLITWNGYNGGFTFIFGNGDGTFSSRSWSGSVGTTTVVADFNNDGILDLVTDLGLSYAQTELGKPDGTFTLKEAFPILPSPKNLTNMVVGDFNKDGFPDIATTRADNTVVIELGKGDGTFTAMPPVAVPGQALFVTDFNADGNLDVGIVTNTLTILPGKGDGTLGAPLNFTSANGLSGPLEVADFNTDGIPDFFFLSPNLSSVIADSSFVMLGGLAWPASIGNIALPPAPVHNIVASYSGSPLYTASTSPSSTIITLPNVTSKLRITNSGFAYSRVTRTFNGTVTLTNISSSAIAGPLQVGFNNLSPGVTLANPTSNVGSGFIAVPAGLSAGQSASITVHFTNPSNSVITYVPVAYTGAF